MNGGMGVGKTAAAVLIPFKSGLYVNVLVWQLEPDVLS